MRTLNILALVVVFACLQPLLASSPGDQSSEPAAAATPPAAQSSASERMVRLVPLEHADAGNVRRMLNSLYPMRIGRNAAQSGVSVEALGDAVILSGQPEAIDLALASIRILDAENPRSLEMRFIAPRAVSVEAVAPVLREVFEQSHRARGKEEMPIITVDSRTGTLIVTATPKDMKLLNEILARLDVEVPSSPPPRAQRRAQIEMTVFEVVVVRDQVAGIEVEKLNEKAETNHSLQEALAHLGKTKVMYRLDESSVWAPAAKLCIACKAPFVRGTHITKSGQGTSQVEYEKLGCLADVEGEWDDATSDSGEVTVSIEMSTMTDSTTDIGNGVLAPVFRTTKQHFAGKVKSGRPIVLLSIDVNGGGDVAVAYVTRLVLRHAD